MTDDHQKRLTEHRVNLLQRMDPTEVVNHLREKEVLTSMQTDNIRHAGGYYNQNVLLLDYLHKKHDYAFGEFHNALRETGQKHLSELLEPNQPNKCAHNRPTMEQHIHSPRFIRLSSLTIMFLLIAIAVQFLAVLFM